MTHPTLDVDHWDEDIYDPSVIVADGHNVKIAVRNGHLMIQDGVPSHPRVRRIPRNYSSRTRLVQLGEIGYITWEAFKWMRECQMTLILAKDVPTFHNPLSVIGQVNQQIACPQYLIKRKLEGCARNMILVGRPDDAKYLRSIDVPPNLRSIKTAENRAAKRYWKAWSEDVTLPWRASDAKQVPEQWLTFGSRRLPWVPTNQDARNPLNAMLNLAYKIGEQACVQACVATGLNPSLGIIHEPREDRNSFALDLLEALRPRCDERILGYIRKTKWFDPRWCHETGKGVCRLDPPLSHTIVGWSGDLFDAALPVAIEVARILRKEK